MSMLEVKDLIIRFHDRIGGEAIHGVSFTMESGERLGIVGESGAGKTLTALRSEAVFHSPELLRGRVEFDRFRRPLSDSGILADGELPFRISAGEFSDSEGNRYLFVLNRDYELAAGFVLALKKNFRVYEVSKEDGMQRVLNDGTDMLRLSLQPGDAVLLRFQDAAEQPFLIDYVLKK